MKIRNCENSIVKWLAEELDDEDFNFSNINSDDSNHDEVENTDQNSESEHSAEEDDLQVHVDNLATSYTSQD